MSTNEKSPEHPNGIRGLRYGANYALHFYCFVTTMLWFATIMRKSPSSSFQLPL